MLHITLDDDNIDLLNVDNTRCNLLLRYGKILENNINKSNLDVKAFNISEQINSFLLKRFETIQSVLVDRFSVTQNKIDSEINLKLTNVNTIIQKSNSLIQQLEKYLPTIDSKINDLQNILPDIENINKNITTNLDTVNKNIDNVNKVVNNTLNNSIETINNSIVTTISNTVNNTITKTVNSNLPSKDMLSEKVLELKSDVKDIIRSNNNIDTIRDVKEVVNEVKNNIRQVKDNLLYQISQLKLDIANNNNESKINDNICTIRNELTKQVSSLSLDLKETLGKNVMKGDIAETEILKYIDNNLAGYETIHMSQEAKKSRLKGEGDIRLRNGKYEWMIESKNYNKNVPSTEIAKFHTALKESKCQGGILYNYNYGIVHITNESKFDIVDGKPVIYICRISRNPASILMAVRMLEMWVDANKILEESKAQIEESELEKGYKELANQNYIYKVKHEGALKLVNQLYHSQLETLKTFHTTMTKILSQL